jgi:8-oxo-dGTP pyrophosphatase MutT (NUDIX family)
MKKRKVQVVIFYCDTNGKKHFLLLKVNAKRGLFWQNITGSVDEGEKFKQAALRESMEETGLDSQNIKQFIKTEIRFCFHDRWGHDVIERVYFIQCLRPWPILLDPKEHCEFKWIGENEVDKNCVEFASNVVALEFAKGYPCV